MLQLLVVAVDDPIRKLALWQVWLASTITTKTIDKHLIQQSVSQI